MSYKEILGVDESEEKIYQTLLVSGQLSTGELRVATKLDSEVLKSSLKNLISKKLIRVVPGLDGRYASLLPIGSLRDELVSSVEQIKILSDKLSTSTNESISKIKSDLDSNSQNFTDQLDQQKNDLDEKYNQIGSKYTGLASQRNDDNKSKISADLSEISGSLDETKTSDLAAISNLNEKIANILSTSKGSLEALNQSLTQESLQIKEDSLSNFPTSNITNLDDSKLTLKDNISSLDPSFQAFKDGLGSQFEESQQEFKSALLASVDGIISSAGELHQDLNSQATNLLEYYTNEINSLKESNSQLNSALNEELSKLVEDGSTIFNEIKSVLSRNIEILETEKMRVSNLISQNSTDSTQFVTESQNSLKAIANENSKNLDEITTDLQSTLSGRLDAEITDFKTKLDQLFNNIKDQTNVQFDTFKSDLVSKVNADLVSLKSKQNESMTQFEEGMQEKVTSLQSNYEATSSSVSKETANQFDTINTSFQETDTKLAATEQGVSTQISSVKTHTENFVNQVSSQLDTNLASSGGNYTAMQEETSSKFSNFVETKILEANENLENQLNTLSEKKNTLLAEISNSTLSFKANLENSLMENVGSVEKSLINLESTLISNLKQSLESLNQKYQELISKGTVINTKYTDDTNTEVTGLMSEIETSITNQIEAHVQKIQSSFAKVDENNQSLIAEFSELSNQWISEVKSNDANSIQALGDLSLTSQSGQVGMLELILKKYQKEYSDSSNTVIEKSHNLSGLLDELFKVQESTDTPKTSTTHIIGKKAIFHQITDLLGRVKSKVTILVPSIDMVDQSIISRMKSAIQVTIISHIDEITDRDWIEEMHGVDANVTLRSIVKSGHGGELPNFVGCEREGEEILLGTIDDAADDYVAISSGSEYFVKILGNIVIADYARGKSKQIKKA